MREATSNPQSQVAPACPEHPVWWKDASQTPGKIVASTEACRTPVNFDLKNREVANLTWLGLFALGLILLCLANRDVGRALLGVLRSLVQRTFLLFGALVTAWIAVCVALLAHLDLWRWDNLKTTIVWALTFTPVAIFQYRRAEKGGEFFRQAILEAIAATVVVQFLIDEYSFPLWIEFLLVPLLALLASLHAVAKGKPEYNRAERFFASLLAIAVIAYFGNAILQLISHFSEFARYETVREFLIPIFLSIAFLPVVYGLGVYAAYETASGLLRVWISDHSLRAYARRRARRAFGLKLRQLKRWSHDVAASPPDSQAAVRASILAVKRNAARALASAPVFLDEGWSPNLAKDYLNGEGFVTGDYHDSYGEWFASSPMVQLGGGGFPDNLAYYVNGDQRVAFRLKLKLNVNNPADASVSLDRLRTVAAILLTAASDAQLAAQAMARLARLKPGTFDVDALRITIIREDFTGGIPDGYSLLLVLEPSGRAALAAS
jgi:hypothetical protein